jgi:hypothetical protein
LLFAACAPVDRPAPAKLWTVEDFQALARQGKSLGGLMPASNLLVQRGQPLSLLSPPFSDAVQAQRSDVDGLPVTLAFSEGQPAAYTTTEVWQGFPGVWIQPLYLPVAGFANGAAQFIADARPVFGVGAHTRFYSPFWQVFYVVLPPGTPSDALKSVRDVFDSGFDIIEGAGTLCVLAPPDVQLAKADGAANAVRPLFGDRVTANYRKGWVEGEEVSYIDFGRNRFTWQEYALVDEAALFDLGIRGPDGEFMSLGLPHVGGTGKLYSNTPARAPNGRPQFGGLWRVHQAMLPGGSGVFVPSARAGLRQALLATANQVGVPAEVSLAPPIAPEIEARPDVNNFTLRAAVNPSCFRDVGGFPSSCRWLDSQANIEREVAPGLIDPTDVLVTCPFLNYANAGIDP